MNVLHNGQSVDGKGIEWAFRKYLNGKDGKILNKKLQKDSGNHS
jgi:cell division protein FtsI (penicillin-binding protein 3)